MEKLEPKPIRYVSYVRESANGIITWEKLGVADSEECSCKRGKEMVDHFPFPFRCGKRSIVRATHKIRELADNRCGDTGYLLGGWSGEGKDGSGGKPLKPRKILKQPTSRVRRCIDSRHWHFFHFQATRGEGGGLGVGTRWCSLNKRLQGGDRRCNMYSFTIVTSGVHWVL